MTLRARIKRSLVLACAYYLWDDWRSARRIARGDLSTRSGSRHHGLSVVDSLAYIEKVHRDYLAYAGRTHFAGMVAEIGPGDNFGVALLTLAGGATRVHAVDRYRPRRDPAQQAAIYRALAARHDLFPLFEGSPEDGAIKGLVYHAGQPAETFFRGSGLRFDAILSRAVLEHLYDPLRALSDMFGALAPGGQLVHRIDLRDHGMFAGLHPLTFLTVPEAIYRRMTRGSGRPNRVLLPAYREWLRASGAKGSLRITRLAGVSEEIEPALWEDIPAQTRARALACVTAIRPKLARPLRSVADEDLAVSGFVLVAEKP